jgi:hypothetical protein
LKVVLFCIYGIHECMDCATYFKSNFKSDANASAPLP